MPPYGNSDNNEAYIGRVYINNATISKDTNTTNISNDISNKDNIALCQEKIAGLLEKYEDIFLEAASSSCVSKLECVE